MHCVRCINDVSHSLSPCLVTIVTMVTMVTTVHVSHSQEQPRSPRKKLSSNDGLIAQICKLQVITNPHMSLANTESQLRTVIWGSAFGIQTIMLDHSISNHHQPCNKTANNRHTAFKVKISYWGIIMLSHSLASMNKHLFSLEILHTSGFFTLFVIVCTGILIYLPSCIGEITAFCTIRWSHWLCRFIVVTLHTLFGVLIVKERASENENEREWENIQTDMQRYLISRSTKILIQ